MPSKPVTRLSSVDSIRAKHALRPVARPRHGHLSPRLQGVGLVETRDRVSNFCCWPASSRRGALSSASGARAINAVRLCAPGVL